DMHSGSPTSPDYRAHQRRRCRSVALGLWLSRGPPAGGVYWSQSTQVDGAAEAKASAAAPVTRAERQQAAPAPPSVEAGSASSAALASSAKGDEPQKISLDEVAAERPPEEDEQGKSSPAPAQQTRAPRGSSGRKSSKKAKKIPKNPYEF